MQITRRSPETRLAPSNWFTGPVWIDKIASTSSPSRLRVRNVHFAPGSRTAWHRHPVGQLIYITEGEGLVQREGGPVEYVQMGHTVWFEPGERHWHGAGASSFMTHLAIQELDEGGSEVEWEEPVSDSEYSGQG